MIYGYYRTKRPFWHVNFLKVCRFNLIYACDDTEVFFVYIFVENSKFAESVYSSLLSLVNCSTFCKKVKCILPLHQWSQWTLREFDKLIFENYRTFVSFCIYTIGWRSESLGNHRKEVTFKSWIVSKMQETISYFGDDYACWQPNGMWLSVYRSHCKEL